MSSVTPPPKLRNKNAFLAGFGISAEKYKKGGLDWRELGEIYTDYLQWMPFLAADGQPFLPKLLAHECVRAVYARPKDPEHLIKKLIIRSAKVGRPYARKGDYLTTVTDLLGLRALHVFKEDWPQINEFIHEILDVRGPPEARVGENDPPWVIQMYKRSKCTITRTDGYRSVHYAIPVRCKRKDLMAELQVRSLFEEAWGEVSHRIDYPIPGETPLLVQFVSLMSDLCGVSDEIASAARSLHELEGLDARRGSRARARRSELWDLFLEKTEFLLNKSPSAARVAILPKQIPADLELQVLKARKGT